MARRMAAWAGMLALSVAGLGAVGRAQEPRGMGTAPGRAERAALRPKLAALRAEVGLLRIEHEAYAVSLKPVIGELLSSEVIEASRDEKMRTVADLKAKFGPARVDPATASLPQSMAGLGIAPPDQAVEEAKQSALDAAMPRLYRSIVDRMKKDFLHLAATLHGKELELEEAEADYRATSPELNSEPMLSEVPGTRPFAVEGLPPVAGGPVVSIPAEPPLAVAATPDGGVAPVPSGVAPACCMDPPSEQEVWAEVVKDKAALWVREMRREDARFLIVKVGEKVDPCKVYPLAGPCELVHCHYKCTVTFDDKAAPARNGRVEVVFIDKDHLRRCGGADRAPAADPTVRAASASGPATEGRADLERRVEAMEKALERLRERLDPSQPATPR